MPNSGSITICPHDYGTTNPTPGVEYLCRLCGAVIVREGSGTSALHPGVVETPAHVPLVRVPAGRKGFPGTA